jgi:uncharacterized membrane protein YhfC
MVIEVNSPVAIVTWMFGILWFLRRINRRGMNWWDVGVIACVFVVSVLYLIQHLDK